MNEVYINAISEARELMYQESIKNKAPSWLLTELAQTVGNKLSDEYKVDKGIVLISLYLLHLVFDPIFGGEIQKNHPNLSAKYVIENKLLENMKN